MRRIIKVTVSQTYNNIELRFPTAMLAGMTMDELIVAADGNISFKVEVEEVPVKDTEEKEDEADEQRAAE